MHYEVMKAKIYLLSIVQQFYEYLGKTKHFKSQLQYKQVVEQYKQEKEKIQKIKIKKRNKNFYSEITRKIYSIVMLAASKRQQLFTKNFRTCSL
eukprot:TRINITY_DN29427_c1_g1_i1.p1 TRINITY_DN29427_c1_g1~~TRINITY_DN29427_c1_g1_i1.p1  ORF type:complete len:101 (-),score=0.94 TRINITY_DN29427_c1_g1_i1:29-310(-)